MGEWKISWKMVDFLSKCHPNPIHFSGTKCMMMLPDVPVYSLFFSSSNLNQSSGKWSDQMEQYNILMLTSLAPSLPEHKHLLCALLNSICGYIFLNNCCIELQSVKCKAPCQKQCPGFHVECCTHVIRLKTFSPFASVNKKMNHYSVLKIVIIILNFGLRPSLSLCPKTVI